eukprot:m.221927 g.221927  ORF g.221927 m.221927 type:complete len:64 (-) comp25816_c1_seq1:3155-3346(-)
MVKGDRSDSRMIIDFRAAIQNIERTHHPRHDVSSTTSEAVTSPSWWHTTTSQSPPLGRSQRGL